MDHEPFHSWIRSSRGLEEEARALGHLDGSKQYPLPMGREIFQYLTTGASVPVTYQLDLSTDNSPLPKRPSGGPRAKQSSKEDTGTHSCVSTLRVQQCFSNVAAHWHR